MMYKMHILKAFIIFISLYLHLLLLYVIYMNFTHLKNQLISENLHQPSQHEIVGARMRERELRVNTTCRGMKKGNDSSALDIMYYAPSHNLFVCATPKVASSTWFLHILHMEGIHPNPEQLHDIHKAFGKRINAKKQLSEAEATERLSNASSIMTVRHPLARLVSAYRDKFAGGKKLMQPQTKDHYRYFWLPAMKALKRSIKPPLQLSFPEFIQFATGHFPKEPHWRPLSQTCSPCQIHYKFVMMMETFAEDLQFIATDLNITTIDLDIRLNNKSSAVKTGMEQPDFLSLDRDSLDLFLQLPITLLRKVLQIYALDFELFAYKVPDELLARVELEDQPVTKDELDDHAKLNNPLSHSNMKT